MRRLQFSLAVVALAATTAAPMPASDPVDALIDELHQCMQQRFNSADGRFGFARIAIPNRVPFHFTTENMREGNAVAALAGARVSVVAYLAARNGRPIKGPVEIAGSTAGAPAAMDLRERGRMAMEAIATNRAYDFTDSGWRFTARPIRATADICLRCHGDSAPKIGDALGAVVYGYRQ